MTVSDVSAAFAFRPRSGRWLLVAISLAATCAVGPWSGPAFGQSVGLTALTTFGSNGWIAPNTTSPYVTGSGNTRTERGLAFNPVTKNLVLVSRASVSSTSNNVVILNGTTGSFVKTMNPTGISLGTFQVNMAGVSEDGAIYVGNLTTGSTVPFKVYKWGSESSTSQPIVASSANPTGGVTRIGDSFDVYGSGAGTKFAAAGTMGSGTWNSFFFSGPLDQTNTVTRYSAIPNTLTASNDYRLSLAFIDSDTLIGNQGASAKITDFGASATITGSVALGAAQRPLDYIVLRGVPYLAVADSNSALVSVYDITNPASPVLKATRNNTTSVLANTDGTGQVAWGDVTIQDGFWFSAPLYTLVTNNGVQAMVFTVPEPATWAMLPAGIAACGGGAFLRSRSRRRRRAA